MLAHTAKAGHVPRNERVKTATDAQRGEQQRKPTLLHTTRLPVRQGGHIFLSLEVYHEDNFLVTAQTTSDLEPHAPHQQSSCARSEPPSL